MAAVTICSDFGTKKNKVGWVEERKLVEDSQEVQTSNYKINKYFRGVVYNMINVIKTLVIYES